uniref:Uncharacterized protein n=1 Tax=Alexandrium monilatum TaxID=311494 RepID=A0A7S4T9J1_9DINO|mmetsp:Transcript_40622/g.121424  ORF Transcript_40622/g.121424 Transcript_40622/m.121424 type:complete len:123 (-) Transcript_40622:141-509(-)
MFAVRTVSTSLSRRAMPLFCTAEERGCIRACVSGQGNKSAPPDAVIVQCSQYAAAGSGLGGVAGALAGLAVDVLSHGATCGGGTAMGTAPGAAVGGLLASGYCGMEFAQCWTQCRGRSRLDV